jgi:hypothetical protein
MWHVWDEPSGSGAAELVNMCIVFTVILSLLKTYLYKTVVISLMQCEIVVGKVYPVCFMRRQA